MGGGILTRLVESPSMDGKDAAPPESKGGCSDEPGRGKGGRAGPGGAQPPSCMGHPERGPPRPGCSWSLGAALVPPSPWPGAAIPGRDRAAPHNVITPSQGRSGGRGRCGAAASLLPGIFSCGPGWERAWPQRGSHSPEEEPDPAAPLGSSGRTMARRGWKNAPASQGWRRERDWAVQPLGDPAAGSPIPSQAPGMPPTVALAWPGAPVASLGHAPAPSPNPG